jgi:hypothetical protein
LPAIVALQEIVAVPDPVMLLGVMIPQVSPVGIVSLRLTDPAKWFTAVRVIVELAELPALTGAGEVAAIVKSRNWKVAVPLWTSGVLVPVIVAV